MILTASSFATKLGPMIALADDRVVYLLDFTDSRKGERKIAQLCAAMQATVVPGSTDVIELLKQELDAYFEDNLKIFTTPLFFRGSEFQQTVWHALTKIPYGATISYADLAKSIGKPSACRAVANANGANRLSLLVPCHRVIAHNGGIDGYAGGTSRKKLLLNHEKRVWANDKRTLLWQ